MTELTKLSPIVQSRPNELNDALTGVREYLDSVTSAHRVDLLDLAQCLGDAAERRAA